MTGGDAKRRWHLLAKALLKSKNDQSTYEEEKKELLRFPTFDLFHINENDQENKIVVSNFFPSCRLRVSVVKDALALGNVLGFNNTGNVCVWPSELCMTHYLLNNIWLITNKRVIEIGGGMTALAGMAVAQSGLALLTHVTDGHESSVANLRQMSKLNHMSNTLDVFNLCWDNLGEDKKEYYDLVLCSDCLFFNSTRAVLCDCIYDLLKSKGLAVIFAPRRGKSLDEFVNLCKNKFEQVTVNEGWDENVVKKRKELRLDSRFNEDVHYPILITLLK